MPYSVPVSSIALLWDPPFLACMLLLGTALGYRVLRITGAATGSVAPLERGVISALLGFGLLQLLPFTLASLRILRPSSLWLCLGLLAALLLPDMLRVVRAAWVSIARRARRRPSVPTVVLVSTTAIAVGFMFVLALAPCTDPDGMGHRLTPSKWWLTLGNLDRLPTLTPSLWPMGGDMMATIAMGVWSDTAAKAMHFVFGLLFLAAVFCLGRRVGGALVGAGAMALTVLPLRLPPNVLDLYGFAYMDLAVGAALAVAVLTWFVWRDTQDHAWLWAVGLAAGVAGSYKLLMLTVGPTLALMAAIDLRRRRMPYLWPALRVALLAAAIPLPWMVRAWWITGNPIYPHLSAIFPSLHWTAEVARANTLLMRYYNWSPTRPWSLPTRVLVLRLSAAAAALVGGLVVWRLRDDRARYLAAIATCIATAIVWATGPYFRYLIPVFPLVLVCALTWFAERTRHGRAFALCVPAIALASLALALPSLARGAREAAPAVLSRAGREAYLDQNIGCMAIWRYINTQLEPQARVLSFSGRAVFYSDRYCYVTDPALQNDIRLDSWEAFASDLRRERIGYIIVAGRSAIPAWAVGSKRCANERAFAARLVASGTVLVRAGGDTLLRIDQASLLGG